MKKMGKLKNKIEKNVVKKNLNSRNIKLNLKKNTSDIPKKNALTTKDVSTKGKKQLRPLSSNFSANINNYRFLFDTVNKSMADTRWVINLRVFEDFKKRRKKLLGEPSFYQNDLEKFKKKRNKFNKSKSAIAFNRTSNSNITNYRHFYKKYDDNHGTYITGPLLKFNLNLRQNSNTTPQHRWISNTNDDSKKYYFSCTNFFKKDLPGKMKDKNIWRPYKIEFKKSEYNGNKLVIKTVKRDERKAYEVFGDHLSLSPYNDKYTEKNMFKIKEFVRSVEQSQARTWYHVKLRNYYNDKDRFSKEKKKWINY